MKKIIHQIRYQQGMTRFTVVCTLLAIAAIAVLTLGYRKFSSPARALPVAYGALSSRGCGCSSISQKSLPEGSWTPAASTYSPAEIAGLRTVLLLPAGASLPLSVAEPKSGVWKAEFGIIDSKGNYTAPPYTPPSGEDEITFTENDKLNLKTFTVLVRILPNPSLPGSSHTPYVISAPITSVDKDGEEQRLGDNSAIVFPKSVPLPAPEFLRNLTVVNPGEKPISPVQVTQRHSVGVSSDKSAYVLPAVTEINTASDAVRVNVNAVAFVPQQAKELPQLAGNPNSNPDPSAQREGRCTDGTVTYHYGRYSESQSNGGRQDIGKATVTAQILKDNPFLTLKVGYEVEAFENITNYTRVRAKLQYTCIHGHHIHTATGTCTSMTTSYYVDPQWAAAPLGRKTGHIKAPWGPESCTI